MFASLTLTHSTGQFAQNLGRLLLSSLSLLFVSAAIAQTTPGTAASNYPTKPIRVIVPSPPHTPEHFGD